MRFGRWIGLMVGALAPMALWAEAITLKPTTVPEWKSVFGRIEARDTIPARSRIGGTLVSVGVEEGDDVTEGQVLATIHDAKLDLNLQSIDAEIAALTSQLENARAELLRGEDLLKRGVSTAQRLDALRTQVSVLENRIVSTRAQRRVVEQQAAEGAVLAPVAGKVIAVPQTSGAVVLPGEVVAMIGGGGLFLRLAVPERHASHLREGLEIQIGAEGSKPGRLAKVYPQIENGRVIADVEVSDLAAGFVNARVLVRLPIGETTALVVPADFVTTQMGLDFVTIQTSDGTKLRRAVVLGQRHGDDVVVLSGLQAGDLAVPAHD